MKFSIQVEGEEKQFFLSFQDAEKKTGISALTIVRIIRSDKDYFRRRSDKKVIFIQKENDEPFIQIDGEDFYSFEDFRDRFGLRRQVFYKKILKQGGKYFLDEKGEIHKVTKRSELLDKLISEYKKLQMLTEALQKQKRGKKMPLPLCLEAILIKD